MEIYEEIQREARERYNDKEKPLQLLPMAEYLQDRGISTEKDFEEKATVAMIGEMLKNPVMKTKFDYNLGIDLLAIDQADWKLLHTKWEELTPEEKARLDKYQLVQGRTPEKLVRQYQFVRQRVGRYFYFSEQRSELQEEITDPERGKSSFEKAKTEIAENWKKFSGTEKLVAVAGLIIGALLLLTVDEKEHPWLAKLKTLLIGGGVLGVTAHFGSKLLTGKGLPDLISDATVTDEKYWEKALDTTPDKADAFNHFLVEAAAADVSFARVYDAFMTVNRDTTKSEKEIDTEALGILDFDGREAYRGLEAVFKKFGKEFKEIRDNPEKSAKQFATIWALLMAETPRFRADLEENFEKSLGDKAGETASKAAEAVSGALGTAWSWTKGKGKEAKDYVKDFLRNVPADEIEKSKLWKGFHYKSEIAPNWERTYGNTDVGYFVNSTTNLINTPNQVYRINYAQAPATYPALAAVLVSEVDIPQTGNPRDHIKDTIQNAYDKGLRLFEKANIPLEMLEIVGGAAIQDGQKYQLYLKVLLPASLAHIHARTANPSANP